jgi:hypothetical protein
VIEPYPVVSITDSLLPGALKRFAAVMAASDGRYLLIDLAEVHVADSTGRIVRQIGRNGRGPGEFVMPKNAFETATGFVIIDGATVRMTTLSKDSLEVVATHRLPGRNTSFPAAFADGRFAFNAPIYSPDQIGHAIHVLSPDGSVLRSFGGNSRYRAGDEAELRRIVSVARDSGSFWVTHPSLYRIERWDSTGHLMAVFERRASWFRAPDALALPGPGSPVVVRLWEGADGLLWVKIAIPPPKIATVIEVLDPRALSVVASTRFESVIATPVAGSFLFSAMKQLPDGQPIVNVWGYRIRR